MILTPQATRCKAALHLRTYLLCTYYRNTSKYPQPNSRFRSLRLYDWLVFLNCSIFPHPEKRRALGSKSDRTPISSLSRQVIFLSPTTCCLPRLPTASHNYLLPPTTTYCLPRLPASTRDYLLPPTTTCCHSRLLATSHDCLVATEPLRHDKEEHLLILSVL